MDDILIQFNVWEVCFWNLWVIVFSTDSSWFWIWIASETVNVNIAKGFCKFQKKFEQSSVSTILL